MPETKSVTSEYRRGVFVLVRKFPSGGNSYITFKYKQKAAQTIMPYFHLAIFNELQFANWYLVNLKQELKKDNASNFPADGPFFIMEILDQATWDFVRKVVLADGVAKDAILNPCEGYENHQCPVTPFNLHEYTDFNKLKGTFAKYPNTHFNLEVNKNN